MTSVPKRLGPKVLIRADASPRIGGGHVVRCLSLADALVARGATVGFVCAAIPDTLAARITAQGHRLHRISAEPGLLAQGEDWDRGVLNFAGQRRDAESSLRAVDRADWVIVDHYRLDAAWLDAVGERSKRLVIDDLANRPQRCEILVDQTLGRDQADYAPWVPKGCRVLAGPRYAILRPEFAELRAQALRRRCEPRGDRRILVSLGTTDVGGITARAIESLRDAGVECPIDAVLMPDAPSLPAIEALSSLHANVSLHVAPSNLGSLMVEADLAVGAPGTTSWERCCLGLPAVTILLARNQEVVAQALDQAGATKSTHSILGVGHVVQNLLQDEERLTRMSAAAFAIADGLGASRVVDAMLGRNGVSADAGAQIGLRLCRPEDCQQLWLWRNEVEVRRVSKNEAPVSWGDHSRWFQAMMMDTDRRVYIAEIDGLPGGMVRFDRVDDYALVSIVVAASARGQGVGRRILSDACDHYFRELPLARLVAEIGDANEASARIFRAAGFELLTDRVAGFRLFQRPNPNRN